MKEKQSDDFLKINSESRKINASNGFAAPAPIPSVSTNNSQTNTNSNLQVKKPSKPTKKCIYYNDLIGKRGKYEEKELKIDQKSSFTIKGTIIEKKEEPREANRNSYGYNGYGYGNDGNNVCGKFKCCGDPNDTNTVDVCLIIIFILMIVFAPVGLLAFCIYYLIRYRETTQ